MAGRGSKPGERRGGRKKGTPNKVTVAAKEAFVLAFQGMGGVPKLREWGSENPTEFYKLYSKLIPVDVTSAGEALQGGVIALPVVTEDKP
jgi:hypothetical protein